jgi:hypothetical protein
MGGKVKMAVAGEMSPFMYFFGIDIYWRYAILEKREYEASLPNNNDFHGIVSHPKWIAIS